MTKTSCKFKVFEAIKSQYCSFHRFVVLYSSCIQSHFVLCTNCYHWWWFVWYFSTASVLGLSVRCVGIKMMWSSHINSPKLLYVKVWKYWNHIMCICFVMPLLLKLWAGIKICTSPSVRLYVCPYVQLELMCLQLLLHSLMDFVHTHTQWPTWHEDDRKDWILRCCEFYMSYGTLSWGAV